MARNHIEPSEEPSFEQNTDHESRERRLTADQRAEFGALVGKEMQLRAQRSQPSAERTNTRGVQPKKRQQHGNRFLSHLMRRGY